MISEGWSVVKPVNASSTRTTLDKEGYRLSVRTGGSNAEEDEAEWMSDHLAKVIGWIAEIYSITPIVMYQRITNGSNR